ncbi:uncharacterized protein LOC135849211 isoform X2 [Planococcus citri]|uniref:uncharacterized protein LOC135849211 isoform X2 n=1 Tax=Planococcus citri TaxID=170843 RepID=UPI0031FA262F
MIPRRILKRKQLPSMSVKKAGDVYKSMTVLHAKRKFRCYQEAFKYLLNLAYENAGHISSLQLNNRALAKGIQKEKENTALQLKEKLATESLYFDLLREYGILKTKLSSFEKNLNHIDERVKTSMIPNLVRLSDDITTLKLNCDVLKTVVGSTYEPDTTTKIYPKNNHGERNPRIISDACVPSPVMEELEDEIIQLTARKCKGGLRNAFNNSSIRDRRMNRSFTFPTSLESSFTEPSSVAEKSVPPPEVERNSNVPSEVERNSHVPSEIGGNSVASSDVESLHAVPDSPTIVTSSPCLPAPSPIVVLRRVLTPVNSLDLNDSVHSTTVISYKEKSPSITTDEDISRILPRSERKRSTHSSYFGQHEESGCNRSFLTERKKSKRSNQSKNGDDDHLNENMPPRKSRSRRRSSFRENEAPPENYSLIGERKKYRTRSSSRNSLVQCDEENSNQSTMKADVKKSLSTNTTFGNETSSENSFNDSRRLRSRSKNVCYKERPLNVKLRKN